MKVYYFGYLYVRLARLIAVLLLLAAGAASLLSVARAQNEATGLRYKAGRNLEAKLSAVSVERERAVQLITKYLGQPPSTAASIQFGKAPADTDGFKTLTAQLDNVINETARTKEFVVTKFEAEVRLIEQKLRDHAAQLANERAPTAPQAAPSSPAIDGAVPSQSPTIFALGDRSALNAKREELNVIRDFLAMLKSSAENPDNARTLERALQRLTDLESLLPTALVARPAQQRATTGGPEPETTPKLAAERVADQLAQARASLREALLSNWALDRALLQASEEIDQEHATCAQAERALKRVWLDMSFFIVALSVSGVLAAFLTRVMADLTQAHLDTATNSAIIAGTDQQE
jgi:hypothetical protein